MTSWEHGVLAMDEAKGGLGVSWSGFRRRLRPGPGEGGVRAVAEPVSGGIGRRASLVQSEAEVRCSAPLAHSLALCLDWRSHRAGLIKGGGSTLGPGTGLSLIASAVVFSKC